MKLYIARCTTPDYSVDMGTTTRILGIFSTRSLAEGAFDRIENIPHELAEERGHSVGFFTRRHVCGRIVIHEVVEVELDDWEPFGIF